MATDISGVSGRAIMDALVAGEHHPRTLAGLAQGRLRNKHNALVDAPTGNFTAHHADRLATLLDTVDHLSARIDGLTVRIERHLNRVSEPHDTGPPPGPACATAQTRAQHAAAFPGGLPDVVVLLDAVPGIGPVTAQIILAEIGWDMSVFPTPGHLVSWANLSPRTIQSGGKNTSRPTGHGNPWL
ncbi:transposase [Streptacidiphilus sp. PAMC 29251]